MNLVQWYPHLKHSHWLLIILSICWYNTRFWHRFRQPETPYPAPLRVLPMLTDSLLLFTGAMMMYLAKWSPFEARWLGLKLLLLLGYIALGMCSMRQKTRRRTLGFYAATMCVPVMMAWLAHCKLNVSCHFFANWI